MLLLIQWMCVCVDADYHRGRDACEFLVDSFTVQWDFSRISHFFASKKKPLRFVIWRRKKKVRNLSNLMNMLCACAAGYYFVHVENKLNQNLCVGKSILCLVPCDSHSAYISIELERDFFVFSARRSAVLYGNLFGWIILSRKCWREFLENVHTLIEQQQQQQHQRQFILTNSCDKLGFRVQMDTLV